MIASVGVKEIEQVSASVERRRKDIHSIHNRHVFNMRFSIRAESNGKQSIRRKNAQRTFPPHYYYDYHYFT